MCERQVDFDEMIVNPVGREQGPRRKILRVIVPMNQPHAGLLLDRPPNEEEPQVDDEDKAEDEMEQEL